MLIIQNSEILNLMKDRYVLSDIESIKQTLIRRGAFRFPSLSNGLFSAALLQAEAKYTGYDNVWVRDNIHIANSLLHEGGSKAAVKNLKALMKYFKKHRHRFEHIIEGKADHTNPMHRPHIKFNGHTLEENQEKWAHAQNDALGYFLWLYCKLILERHISPSPEDCGMLYLFPRYWEAVKYWQDEDSGHWEEVRKISASSIGVVVSALTLLKKALEAQLIPEQKPGCTLKSLEKLIHRGSEALERILPWECRQDDPLKQRRYDSALLFLLYPLEAVGDEKAELILQEVKARLQGDYGIKRYLGDSFWCANYKEKLGRDVRTADFSDSIEQRDAMLKQDEEAQWCIFDPIISVIHGNLYLRSCDPEHLKEQAFYFNRSLGQLTCSSSGFSPLRCPELYYLENGRYRPNDVTPLLWTQANLYLAINAMKKSLKPGRGRKIKIS